MTNINGQVEIQDFTLDRPKTRKFKIDDDVFDAVAVIPLGLMKQLLDASSGIKEIIGASDIEMVIEKTKAVMKLLLVPTAYERFVARLTDQESPIGMEHLAPLLVWLVEGYALRPTPPSSPSSDGLETADESTSLTAGASEIRWPGLVSTPVTA